MAVGARGTDNLAVGVLRKGTEGAWSAGGLGETCHGCRDAVEDCCVGGWCGAGCGVGVSAWIGCLEGVGSGEDCAD